MTASAIAARVADDIPASIGLIIIVIGGLVEGVALGLLQSAWLARRFPGLSRLWWTLITTAVAGVGWALASAPAALGDDSGAPPPVFVILLASAGLGAAMGALMGVAQAAVLVRAVPHPWRWIPISTLAWMPTMVVIFAGATLPDASWSTPSVVVTAAMTGLIAGAALGGVSILFMAGLTDAKAPGRERSDGRAP
ncbi:hypothetical protein GCM10009777_02910 [Microbacterium pumilum]|uniref:Uncharacterized protein n=2 Tax=Microbacterium pumilum TaxID=344165 RepID=A0ABN2RSC7_9MICO